MSFEELKTSSFCAGARYHSNAISIESVVAKTVRKLLICQCVPCNRRKTLIVSDNTRAAEGVCRVLKKLIRKSAKAF